MLVVQPSSSFYIYIYDVEVMTKVKQNICKLEVEVLKDLRRQNEQTFLGESAAN